MAFTRVRPPGWAFGEILTSAQMNTLDTNHANAIDGAAGGSYTPTSVINITDASGGGMGDVDFTNANAIWTGSVNYPGLGSRSLTRTQPLAAMAGKTTGTNRVPEGWYFDATEFGWTQLLNSHLLVMPIPNIIDLAQLTAITIDLNAGGYTTLPTGTNLPYLSLKYVDTSATVTTPLASAATETYDSSGTLGAFQASHSITHTLDTPITINQTSSPVTFYAYIKGVYPTGFEADKLVVTGLRATFTVTKLTP